MKRQSKQLTSWTGGFLWWIVAMGIWNSPVAEADQGCNRLHDEATRCVHGLIPDYAKALKLLASVVVRCERAIMAADAARYAGFLGRYDEAALWQTYAVKWSKHPTEKAKLLRIKEIYTQKAIQSGRQILQQERMVGKKSRLMGQRSARGGFELRGPSLQQRLRIERGACETLRKSKKINVYRRVSKPLNIRILFYYKTATWRTDMKPMLEIVLETLRPFLKKEGCVLVVGHTDLRGRHRYNLRLSEKRAYKIIQFLKRHGLPVTKLQASGMGMLQPLDKENDDDAHQRNRRVEFTLLQP